MTARTWTLLFIAAVIITIAVVDSLWAGDRVLGNTISEVILRWQWEHRLAGMMFLIAVGVLLGHLCWPQEIAR